MAVQRRLEGAVGRQQVDVPGGIGRRAAAGHPDRGSGATAVGSGVEGGRLRQGGLAEGDDPARVRRRIAVGGKARIQGAVRQQQRRALRVLARIEAHGAALRRVARGDRDRTAEQLRAGGDIECVQPLVIVRRAILGHRDDVERAVRAGIAVDDGRRRDADLRRDLAAAVHRFGRGFTALQQRNLPQRRAAVGVEGVHRIILGGHEHDIVRAALHGQPGEVQGLRIHLAVDRQQAQEAEAARLHVRGGERGLGQVLPGARQIVFVGRDVGATRRRRAPGGGLAGLIGLARGAASTRAPATARRRPSRDQQQRHAPSTCARAPHLAILAREKMHQTVNV